MDDHDLPPASEILMMQARDRRTADDRVSDALDRLTNRKVELEAAIARVLAVWDTADFATVGVWSADMTAAIAELRGAVQ
jgi:hypothetical protein